MHLKCTAEKHEGSSPLPGTYNELWKIWKGDMMHRCTGSSTGYIPEDTQKFGISILGILGQDIVTKVADAKASAMAAMYESVEAAVRDGRVAIECAVGPDGATTMRAVVPTNGFMDKAPEGVTLQVCPACASVAPEK